MVGNGCKPVGVWGREVRRIRGPSASGKLSISGSKSKTFPIPPLASMPNTQLAEMYKEMDTNIIVPSGPRLVFYLSKIYQELVQNEVDSNKASEH